MRNPNYRRNTAITASMRARSHSFSGLAPPAYEEEEPLTRAASSLAIPLPSYEEAISVSFNISSSTIELDTARRTSVRDLENGENENVTTSSSQIIPQNGVDEAILNNSTQLEQNQHRNSRSSQSSSLNSSQFSKKKQIFKIAFLVLLSVFYCILAYFLYDPIVAWLDPKTYNEAKYYIIGLLVLPTICLACSYKMEKYVS